jgi:hypothetical protein
MKSLKEFPYFNAIDMMSFSCFWRVANQKIKLPMTIRMPMAMISFAASDCRGCLKMFFMGICIIKRELFFLKLLKKKKFFRPF